MRATFPHLAFWQAGRFEMTGQAMAAPQGITGAQTVVATMRGRWKATATFFLHNEAAYLQWETFVGQMQGQLGTTLVPAWAPHLPKDRNGNDLSFDDIANLQDAQTWEHFGFENTPLNRITLAAAASLRATQLSLNLFDTTGIRPGHKIGIGERMHRVLSHWEPSAGAHRILIDPPMRTAAGAGTRLEIERPVCLMRFASEAEGTIDHTPNAAKTATVNFVEAI